MLTQVKTARFYALKGVYGQEPNAYHEGWLNDTLPWIWITSLQHFVGTFPAGYTRTGQGLKGPYRADMYVQKLPTPTDLMTAPV